MDASDVAFALACATKIEPGLQWDGSLPEVQFIDRPYLGSVSGNVDRDGNTVMNSSRMTGSFIGNKAYFSNRATPEVMAHEMTHYLQKLNGVDMGRVGGTPEQLAARRAAEAQGYNVERNAPYECFDFWGNWKTSLMDDYPKAGLMSK